MKEICIIADCIDDQYAGIYTYGTELILEIEKNKPKDMNITYIHYKENDFFAGMDELIIPMGKKFPGRSTLRKFCTLPRILKQKGFDLVHDLYHIAPFPFKKTSYKKVITIHDITPVLFPEYHVPQGFWIQKFVLPLMMRNADHVITVSEHTKMDIGRFYKRRDAVTAVALATRELPASLFKPVEEQYILFVGTLEPRKNIETLIKSFEVKKRDGYKGGLVLIGKKGWKCEYLFEMIAASEWKNYIFWKGYVSVEELSGYYKNAEVFVYPSLYEGFGLPLLEAMQFGIPVVAGRNSSITEVVGDAGMLFQADLEAALSDRLQALLLSPDAHNLRKEYGEKALKRSREFSWKKTARETLGIYEEMLFH